MTVAARTIVSQAQTLLQDPEGIRWPASELVGWLDRAEVDIQTARPDTTATISTLALAEGHKQLIPATAALLIDIPANTSGERITKTDLVLLDAVEPNWRNRTKARVIRHFHHDMRVPRQFIVYPPAASGASVDIELSLHPVPLPATSGDGKLPSTVTGNTTVQDQWSTALLSMVLHYAYAKDAEYGGNAALSAAYFQRAQSILGVELQSSATVAPTT